MSSNGPRRGGILSDLPDLDGPRKPRQASFRAVEAVPGLVVDQRGTRVRGAVVSIGRGRVVLRGRDGRDREAELRPGGFLLDGERVTLVPVKAGGGGPAVTASGSVAVPDAAPRVARASRLLVEGVHDAELVEKVWGDDLRVEGIVVELLDGADHLAEEVRRFGPRSGRRLGVLLDHLVDGSKEQRIAREIHSPDVLVCGHPFVDIWAAVDPRLVGLDAWPDIPRGQPWKDGICAAVGEPDPRRFWRRLLGSVSTYADLAPPLVGAVEQLIDFVTEP